jgi:sulfur carrier protein ThiS
MEGVAVTIIFAATGTARPPVVRQVPTGTTLTELLRELGLPVEGSSLWWNGEPVPSDFPVDGPGRLEIARTFSGG